MKKMLWVRIILGIVRCYAPQTDVFRNLPNDGHSHRAGGCGDNFQGIQPWKRNLAQCNPQVQDFLHGEVFGRFEGMWAGYCMLGSLLTKYQKKRDEIVNLLMWEICKSLPDGMLHVFRTM